jgi:hypothetical protein
LADSTFTKKISGPFKKNFFDILKFSNSFIFNLLKTKCEYYANSSNQIATIIQILDDTTPSNQKKKTGPIFPKIGESKKPKLRIIVGLYKNIRYGIGWSRPNSTSGNPINFPMG